MKIRLTFYVQLNHFILICLCLFLFFLSWTHLFIYLLSSSFYQSIDLCSINLSVCMCISVFHSEIFVSICLSPLACTRFNVRECKYVHSVNVYLQCSLFFCKIFVTADTRVWNSVRFNKNSLKLNRNCATSRPKCRKENKRSSKNLDPPWQHFFIFYKWINGTF